MGLFDTVRCDYPLPDEGANALEYQTKSMNSCMAEYRIAADGHLMIEDRGIFTSETNPPEKVAEVPVTDFIGEIRFYASIGKAPGGWIEWSAYFVRGKLRELHLIHKGESRLSDASP